MQYGLQEFLPKQHRAYMKKCLVEEWKNQCCYCGYTQKHKELTLDHIIPLSKEGDDSYENQVPCCRSCNLSKGNKAIRQWYFYSEDFTTERWLKIKQHMNSKNVLTS